MQKILRSKWTYLGLSIVIFFIFSFGVYRSPLSERGIVIGLGIDTAGDEIAVSAQVIMPSYESRGDGSYIVCKVQAKTLGTAIEKMGAKLGVNASLGHCQIIIFGEDAVSGEVMKNLLYLQKEGRVREETMLAVTEGLAADLLGAQMQNKAVLSLYLSALLRKDSQRAGTNTTTLLEFCKNYLGKKTVNTLPYVLKNSQSEKTASKSDTDTPDEQSEGESFDIFTSIVRAKNGDKYFLGTKQSFAYSIAMTDTRQGQITTEDEEGAVLSANIAQLIRRVEYDVLQSKIIVRLDMKCHLEDVANSIVAEGADRTKEKGVLEKYLVDIITQTFYESKAKGFDLFRVWQGFARQGGIEWLTSAEEMYLMGVEIEVSCQVGFV